MNPGLLRHRIVIQYDDLARNGAEITKTPKTLVSVWAYIESLSGREYIQAQQVNSEVTHRISIRYRPEAKPSMRVLFGNRRFQIVTVLHDEQKRDATLLMCKEVN